MLVAFLGVPCSGKTTTAAKLFADLKEAGIPAEFLAEYARYYIALMKDSPDDELSLTDDDQVQIMMNQRAHEATFLKACGKEVVTIIDGSALNSLMYMSQEARDKQLVQNLTAHALKSYDLVFICEPVEALAGLDPNRVHSFEDSIQLSGVLDRLILDGPLKDLKPIVLRGDPNVRLQTAQKEVYRKLLAK